MISIAMATYNGEQWLREQIESVLAQTSQDFELVACDDCSGDSTWEILREYEKRDRRVKAFRNERNMGFVRNFERAVSLCTGDYIALADQDDVWEQNHLEVLMRNLKDAIGVVGNAKILDSSGTATNDLISEREHYYVDGDDEDKLFRILFYGNPFQGASSLFKREMFENALPIPDGVEYHDAWFNAFACCMASFNFTPQIVNGYRIHGGNASGSHKRDFLGRVHATLRRKGWQTDRTVYCDELLRRIPDMSGRKREIVLMARDFHEGRIRGKRLRTIATILRHYKKIYSTNNYKHALARCVGILLRG